MLYFHCIKKEHKATAFVAIPFINFYLNLASSILKTLGIVKSIKIQINSIETKIFIHSEVTFSYLNYKHLWSGE